MKKFLSHIVLSITLSLACCCLTYCEPYYLYDEYDWYYDCGPMYLSHCISTNGQLIYVRTRSCPTVTYDMYKRVYCCWDYGYLILTSNRPITVHHTHNDYR